jgi:alpha-tubulin suppressor-like RCC1 family protein
MKRLLVSTILAMSMLMPFAAQAAPSGAPLPAPLAAPLAVQTLAPNMPLKNVLQVSAGYFYSCALLSTGGVKCWGSNKYGQLGDNTATIEQLTPVDVSGLTSGVIGVSAGYYHACALLSGGGVKCWGYNGSGQLGDGTTTERRAPVDVSGLSSGVTALAAGGYHTCALLAGGGVKCWGANGTGQLGDGSTSQHNTPEDVKDLESGAIGLTAGALHTCALLESGGVKCWGFNGSGQLGDGTIANRSKPTDVDGLTSGATTVAAGYAHTCAALAAGGAKCWGYNLYGQLGDGTNTDSLTPVPVSGLTTGVAALAAGGNHTCGRLTGGGLKCWGYNEDGQLGDGTTTDSSTPVDVGGLTSGAASVTAGGRHTCAGLESAGVKCWGNNDYGQLGDGTHTLSSTPVYVNGLGPLMVVRLPLVVR